MDYRVAEFVRFVDGGERLEDLIDEAKADTWTKGREHAAVVIDGGEIVLVRGGRDGIEFEYESRIGVVVTVRGRLRRLARLAWHTHPRPTGPSDHDRRLLEWLEQGSSVVYEIGGDKCRTLFTQKKGEV